MLFGSAFAGRGAPLGFGSRTKRRLGAAAPILIQPATTLTTHANRASLQGSPPAQLTDIADPGNGLTMLVSGLNPGTTITWTTQAFPAPVDMTLGTFLFDYQPLAYMEQLLHFTIRLFSEGTPAAPSANFIALDTFSNGPSGIRLQRTSKTGAAGQGRRQTVGIPRTTANFVASGTGADVTSIKYAQIALRSNGTNTTTTATFRLGPLRWQRNPLEKAMAIVTYDDCRADAWTAYINHHLPKRIPMVLMPGAPLADLGQAGRLTAAQVREMVASGLVQWGYQTGYDENAASFLATTPQQRLDLANALKAQAEAEGLGGRSYFGSYFSAVNPTEVSVVDFFQRFHAARTFMGLNTSGQPIQFGETYPWPDPLFVRAGNCDGATQERITAHKDQAIANRGVAFFCMHDGSQANVGFITDMLVAEAASIEATTEQDLYQRYQPAGQAPLPS